MDQTPHPDRSHRECDGNAVGRQSGTIANQPADHDRYAQNPWVDAGSEAGETRYEKGVTWTTRRQRASNQLVPLPEPARRGLINLADDVIATTNQAVAAAAQLDPSDVTRSTRSGRGGAYRAFRRVASDHPPAGSRPKRTTPMNCTSPGGRRS